MSQAALPRPQSHEQTARSYAGRMRIPGRTFLTGSDLHYYYLKRAIVSQAGLGANLPQDAVCLLDPADAMGRPLDGKHKGSPHFDKGSTPPVEASWSVILYDPEGFDVAGGLDRLTMSRRTPFQYNLDGSLDRYIVTESPGKAIERNGPPAPKGSFDLAMLLYEPETEALPGRRRRPTGPRFWLSSPSLRHEGR